MANPVNIIDVQVGGESRPFAISYIVIKRFQKEANVSITDLQNLQLHKLEILMYHGFKRGLEINQKQVNFKQTDIEMWLENEPNLLTDLSEIIAEQMDALFEKPKAEGEDKAEKKSL